MLDGRSVSDGIAWAYRRITPKLDDLRNYTYLDSEVLQSVSDYCLANPGAGFTPPGGDPITCAASDVQAGNS